MAAAWTKAQEARLSPLSELVLHQRTHGREDQPGWGQAVWGYDNDLALDSTTCGMGHGDPTLLLRSARGHQLFSAPGDPAVSWRKEQAPASGQPGFESQLLH